MLQIEKRDSKGNIIPMNDIEYTVETNFSPKGSANRKFLQHLSPSNPLGISTSSYLSTTALDGIIAMTQQVYNPLKTGSIMLKNKSNYSFGAMDLMRGDYTSDPTGVIAVADVKLGWFNSTDSFRGTYNPQESFVKETPSSITTSLVFDFHVSGGVGEINEIEYYSKPVFLSDSDKDFLQKSGAYNFTNGCMSFVDPVNSLDIEKNFSKDCYALDFKIDGEGNIYRVWSNSSSNLPLQVKNKDGDTYIVKNLVSKLSKLSCNGKTLNFAGNYWKLDYIADKLYLSAFESTGVNNCRSFATSRYFVPILNIIPPSEENPDGDVEFGTPKEFKFTSVEQLPLGWMSANTRPSLSENYTIGTSVTLNDKHYLIICGTNRRRFAFVEITEDLEIVKSHNATILSSDLSGSGGIRIYPYYDTKSGELFIHLPSDYNYSYDSSESTVVTYKISSDLDSAEIPKKVIWRSLTNLFIRYPHIDKVYTIENVINPTAHTYKPDSYGGVLRMYRFGEMVNTTANPLIKIKLNEPIVKNEGEFLKITLNINLS